MLAHHFPCRNKYLNVILVIFNYICVKMPSMWNHSHFKIPYHVLDKQFFTQVCWWQTLVERRGSVYGLKPAATCGTDLTE